MAEDLSGLQDAVYRFEKRWLLANHDQTSLVEIRAAAHRFPTVSIPSGLALRLTRELEALREYLELLPPDTVLRVLYELRQKSNALLREPAVPSPVEHPGPGPQWPKEPPTRSK